MTTVKLAPIPKGTYIVSVSGGVDSVALLNMLTKQEELKLIVAHIDHGIRKDAHKDENLVRGLAMRYGLLFESTQLQLGPNASEQKARDLRYNFLRQCSDKYDANAIIMGHHQDDVLETIILNILRGTGWRGLSSLRSHPGLIRPMLHLAKSDITTYAISKELQWHEDITNEDTKYLRNYIRHAILPHFQKRPLARNELLKLWHQQSQLYESIADEADAILQQYTEVENKKISIQRYTLIMLPQLVALELLQAVAIKLSGARLEQKQVERLLLFSRTAREHKKIIASSQIIASLRASSLIVEPIHI